VSENAAVQRALVISTFGAIISMAPLHHAAARVGKMEHALPSTDAPAARSEARPDAEEERSAVAPPPRRRQRRSPQRRGPQRWSPQRWSPQRWSPQRWSPRQSAPVGQGQPRAATGPDPEVVFAALKLFRVNQRAMIVCDRIAVRRGVDPPPRLGFLLRVNAAGDARGRLLTRRTIRPGIARCYRTIAASWSYPSTGAPYTLTLSRITRGGTGQRNEETPAP
jgi:hypothetical protein